MLGSLFQVGATAKPGHSMEEIAAAVTAEIDRLAAEGPTSAELARARNTHMADFYKGLDHLADARRSAQSLQHVLGNPDGVGRDVARYEQDDDRIGARRVRARGRRPPPGPAHLPEPATARGRAGDRVIETPAAMAEAPAVGPLPRCRPAARDAFKLSSGLEVVAVRRNVAPIVSAAFMFRSGGAYDPAARTGLASITAEMLDEGAGPRDALAIAAELEQLGCRPVAGERIATARSCRCRRRATRSAPRWGWPPTS
jgi:zinc protease